MPGWRKKKSQSLYKVPGLTHNKPKITATLAQRQKYLRQNQQLKPTVYLDFSLSLEFSFILFFLLLEFLKNFLPLNLVLNVARVKGALIESPHGPTNALIWFPSGMPAVLTNRIIITTGVPTEREDDTMY